ncbi:MAG: hypothetical protein LBC39_05855 [Methanobrevibacter sp.]|nr:hypothetical protein [Candidatus Methanovirga aequatorialis]
MNALKKTYFNVENPENNEVEQIEAYIRPLSAADAKIVYGNGAGVLLNYVIRNCVFRDEEGKIPLLAAKDLEYVPAGLAIEIQQAVENISSLNVLGVDEDF